MPASRKMKFCGLIVMLLMAFGSRDVYSGQNLVLRTEIITSAMGRTVAEQALPANGKAVACAGLLRAHTPFEAKDGIPDHLIEGAFCDGYVVQASLVAERPTGAEIKWTIHSSGLSPSNRRVTEDQYVKFGTLIAMSPENCHSIGAQSITLSVIPATGGKVQPSGFKSHDKNSDHG